MERFELDTPAYGFVDITARVRQIVRENGIEEGLCVVYCPHTTAAITINENADPDVVRDLKLALADIFPDRRDFKHAEGQQRRAPQEQRHRCVGDHSRNGRRHGTGDLAGHLLLRVRRPASSQGLRAGGGGVAATPGAAAAPRLADRTTGERA